MQATLAVTILYVKPPWLATIPNDLYMAAGNLTLRSYNKYISINLYFVTVDFVARLNSLKSNMEGCGYYRLQQRTGDCY